MYGWRARLGFVCPSIYDTTALEFERITPEGVIIVVNTMNIQILTDQEFDRAWSVMEESARQLIMEEADVVIIGGDPVQSLKGFGSEQPMLQRLRQVKDVPVATTLNAVVDGWKALEVKRLAIASPYIEERNQQLARYLEAAGFEVVGAKGLNITKNIDLSRLTPDAAYRVCKEAAKSFPQAQGVYLPCGRWPTVEVLEALEQDLGIPVFSNIAVYVWWGMKRLNMAPGIRGYGRLLASLSEGQEGR